MAVFKPPMPSQVTANRARYTSLPELIGSKTRGDDAIHIDVESGYHLSGDRPSELPLPVSPASPVARRIDNPRSQVQAFAAVQAFDTFWRYSTGSSLLRFPTNMGAWWTDAAPDMVADLVTAITGSPQVGRRHKNELVKSFLNGSEQDQTAFLVRWRKAMDDPSQRRMAVSKLSSVAKIDSNLAVRVIEEILTTSGEESEVFEVVKLLGTVPDLSVADFSRHLSTAEQALRRVALTMPEAGWRDTYIGGALGLALNNRFKEIADSESVSIFDDWLGSDDPDLNIAAIVALDGLVSVDLRRATTAVDQIKGSAIDQMVSQGELAFLSGLAAASRDSAEARELYTTCLRDYVNSGFTGGYLDHSLVAATVREFAGHHPVGYISLHDEIFPAQQAGDAAEDSVVEGSPRMINPRVQRANTLLAGIQATSEDHPDDYKRLVMQHLPNDTKHVAGQLGPLFVIDRDLFDVTIARLASDPDRHVRYGASYSHLMALYTNEPEGFVNQYRDYASSQDRYGFVVGAFDALEEIIGDTPANILQQHPALTVIFDGSVSDTERMMAMSHLAYDWSTRPPEHDGRQGIQSVARAREDFKKFSDIARRSTTPVSHLDESLLFLGRSLVRGSRTSEDEDTFWRHVEAIGTGLGFDAAASLTDMMYTEDEEVFNIHPAQAVIWFEQSREILKNYPPETHFYVGVGSEAAPVLASLRITSDFRTQDESEVQIIPFPEDTELTGMIDASAKSRESATRLLKSAGDISGKTPVFLDSMGSIPTTAANSMRTITAVMELLGRDTSSDPYHVFFMVEDRNGSRRSEIRETFPTATISIVQNGGLNGTMRVFPYQFDIPELNFMPYLRWQRLLGHISDLWEIFRASAVHSPTALTTDYH